MQTHERFAYLFRRYLDKTLTPGEIEEMRTYISNPDYDEDLRALIREGWNHDWPPEEQELARVENIFRTIVKQGSDAPRLHRLWWWAAATIGLGAMATGAYLLSDRPAPAREAVQATPFAAPKRPAHQYLALPDGSKVLLNEGATLEYRNSFSTKERAVHLSGEAFFTVRKDTKRPFVVYTGAVRIVVLGTTFNIRAYPSDKDVTITVTTGKVKVIYGSKTLGIVAPNEQVRVSGIGDAVKKLQVDADRTIAWKQQDLLFDDLPMQEVVRLLEQRFHVNFVFENPVLADCHITAAFVRQESLQDIVKVITRVNNLEYRISGDSVWLSGQGCR